MDEYGVIALILLLCVMCSIVCRSYITTIWWSLRTRSLIHATMVNTIDGSNESEILIWRAEQNFITAAITGYCSLLRLAVLTIVLNIITLLVLPAITNENVWMIVSVILGGLNAFVISTFMFCLQFKPTIQTIYIKHNKIN